jgi:anti-sigma factor RsiW
MREENLHVADDELLVHAAGELRASSSRQIRTHLASCTRCRARLSELETTLTEFGEAQKAWAPELPPIAGPRALLKARLTELAERESGSGWRQSAWSAVIEHRHATILVAILVAVCLLLAIRLQGPMEKSRATSASLGHWEEPDLRLTPGVTVSVTENDVCGGSAERTVPVVPVSLKRKVFELYGVSPLRPDAYEVDYLITPELGGATDIRNLWPEPYQDTVWNAHVKDQLEDRLHRMVCHGDVDLATAQHEISTDWIGAYRKYFHADKPVSDGSSFNLPTFRRSLPHT